MLTNGYKNLKKYVPLKGFSIVFKLFLGVGSVYFLFFETTFK